MPAHREQDIAGWRFSITSVSAALYVRDTGAQIIADRNRPGAPLSYMDIRCRGDSKRARAPRRTFAILMLPAAIVFARSPSLSMCIRHVYVYERETSCRCGNARRFEEGERE